jgi:hypothetical protein
MDASPWKGMYKIGGVALVLAVAVRLAAFIPAASSGARPSSGEELLVLVGQNSPYDAFLISLVLFDSIAILGVLALYLALIDTRRSATLISVALWEIGWFSSLLEQFMVMSIASLNTGYAAATSEAQRTAFLAASDLAFGFSFGAPFIAADITISISILMIGVIMLKGFSEGASLTWG